MASSKFQAEWRMSDQANWFPVKISKPRETEEGNTEDAQKKAESEMALPQTLVRIPTEHAPILQASSATATGNGEP